MRKNSRMDAKVLSFRSYLENKSLKKSKSTCLRNGHRQTQRRLHQGNNRVLFYVKGDECLLGGGRFQKEQAGSS